MVIKILQICLFLVGKKIFISNPVRPTCSCCPYGYHIDLDFVRYCEAIAAKRNENRLSDERRKKKERRRQCQSMEFLLGLVSSFFLQKNFSTLNFHFNVIFEIFEFFSFFSFRKNFKHCLVFHLF